MDLFSIIIIGIGLAMDCFAVSISQGMCAEELKFKPALKMGLLFGIFQGLMPIIGFMIGKSFQSLIKDIDHWIAFVILSIIGIKMIYESIAGKKEEEDKNICSPNRFKFSILLTLALATSIDALATGFIFVSFPSKIWVATSIIGAISFILTMIGVKFGHVFGKKLQLNFELLGGVILILIGVKILIEHLYF